MERIRYLLCEFWKGAALGQTVVVLLIGAVIGSTLATGLPFVLDMLLGMILAFLSLALVDLVFIIAGTLGRDLPRILKATSVGGILFLAVLLYQSINGLKESFLIGFPLLLFGTLSGISLAIFAKRKRIELSAVITLLLALAVLIPGYRWLTTAGDSSYLRTQANQWPVTEIEPTLVNPSEPGSYRVYSLTYGSGSDKRRAEYGEQVDLITNSVDATAFLPALTGLHRSYRAWFWGFDIQQFPLNARVWYPDGEGPFPLVLIVHGNHDWSKPSEAGYAYLGELFASQGYITASVDQNFLNGSFFGIRNEMQARAWLLLEHLQQWHAWNAQPDHPFYQKVDTDNIALIGHSRGGEAVTTAAAFNRLPYYPDNAQIEFNYDFNIRALAAIAPSDGQYRPADQFAPLENVNYLVLQGGHDADVYYFLGQRLYDRIAFTDENDWFYAGVYLHQANHGQFNSVWGRYDLPLHSSWFLNTEPVMAEAEQQQLAKVYLAGFLAATLQGEPGYISMFTQPQHYQSWTNHPVKITQFKDSTHWTIANFREDLDLTTTTLPGGQIHGDGLRMWREQNLELTPGVFSQNQVAYLRWSQQPSPPSYTITLPEPIDRDAMDSFVLLVANASDNPRLDFGVELVSADGSRSALPLSAFQPLSPRLHRSLTTSSWIERAKYNSPYVPVLQTIIMPISEFALHNPEFNTDQIQSIRLVFDASEEGAIYLAEVGGMMHR